MKTLAAIGDALVRRLVPKAGAAAACGACFERGCTRGRTQICCPVPATCQWVCGDCV